jgi:hypothetical protein
MATNSFGSDCKKAATSAASVETLQSEIYYHCKAEEPSFDSNRDLYTVKFDCVGQSGSGSLSYQVSFSDDNSCSAPTVTAF